MAKVTLKDVAARAGVSYQTVSKVLNGTVSVLTETENRIHSAAQELGYRANISARNLRTQTSQRIGYPWQRRADDTPIPVMDRFFYNAIAAAETHNYHILTFLNHSQKESDLSIFRDMVAQQQVDGFILADTNHDDPRIAYLMAHNLPFVSFGRANDAWEHSWVDVNGRSGLCQTIHHLATQGHERIALVTWPNDSRAGAEREAGYREGLADKGLAFDPRLIIRGNNEAQTGALALERLWALPPSQRPTAFACVSDTIALGILKTAVSHNIQVGRDIAVTGFDDSPIAELFHPTLTSVRQPIAEIGRLIIELLLDQINHPSHPKKGVLLEPELIIRNSSAQSRHL